LSIRRAGVAIRIAAWTSLACVFAVATIAAASNGTIYPQSPPNCDAHFGIEAVEPRPTELRFTAAGDSVSTPILVKIAANEAAPDDTSTPESSEVSESSDTSTDGDGTDTTTTSTTTMPPTLIARNATEDGSSDASTDGSTDESVSGDESSPIEIVAVTKAGLTAATLRRPPAQGSESFTVERDDHDQLLVVVLEAKADVEDDPEGVVEVLAIVDAEACSLISLEVSRDAKPSVTFGGADPSGALALQIDAEQFDVNVALIVEPSDLAIEVDPVQFIDEDGHPFKLKPSILGSDRTLIADGEVVEPKWLRLEAEDPVPNTVKLSGVVTIRWGGDGAIEADEARLSLSINRQPLPPRITIDPSSAGRTSTGCVPYVTCETFEVTRVVIIHETTGIAQQIEPPTILAASRDDADDDEDVGSKVELVGFSLVTPAPVAASRNGMARLGAPQVGGQTIDDGSLQPLTIDAGRPTAIRVAIRMPEEPGKYEIALSFDGDQTGPVTHTITTQVRRSEWIPLTLLIAGLVLAALLRFGYGGWRKRQTHGRSLAAARDLLQRAEDRLPTPLPPEVTTLLQVARTRLIDLDKYGDVDAEVAQAVAHSMVLGRDYLRLAVAIHNSNVKPKAILDELAELGRQLTEYDASEDAAAAETRLADAVKKLSADWKGAVKQTVVDSAAQLRLVLGTFANDPASAATELAVVTSRVEVDPLGAAQQLTALEAQMLPTLTAELSSRIEAFEARIAAPPSADKATGTRLEMARENLQAATTSAADPHARLYAVRDGLEHLAHAKAGRLAQLIAASVGQRAADEVAEYRRQLDEQRQKIADDPGAAGTALDNLIDNFTTTDPDPVARAAAAQVVAANQANAGPPVPPLVAVQELADPPSLRTVQVYERRLVVLELFVLLLAMVLAVPIGYQMLYDGEPTWGSLLQMLTAFFFGLGAQQLIGGTFTGLTGFRNSLVGETTP
jgi:hypothetical protein